MNTKDSILKAISLLGGPVAAARALRVKRYQTVQQWAATGRVPAKYCPEIERLLDGEVICEHVCPDVDWAFVRGQAVSAERAAA